LQRGDVTPEKLLQDAPTEAGIYRQHLRQQLAWLHANPSLLAAYQQVIGAKQGIKLEAITAYRLDSLGLVKLSGNVAIPSCDLYRLYFAEQLALNE
jgi:AAA-like domain